MFNILKMHLENNEYDNHLYFGLTEEELQNIECILKNNSDYIDLVLDFKDLERLKPLIENIPEHCNKESVIKIIYENYICLKLLEQIDIPKYLRVIGYKNIEQIKEILFNDNYEMFFNMNFLHLWSLERYISNISKEQNTRARLHIFIDKIDDKILQRLINTMIGSRMSIAVMGYSSNEELITYNTNINQVIENPHDYCAYYKEEFYARLRKKYNLE